VSKLTANQPHTMAALKFVVSIETSVIV